MAIIEVRNLRKRYGDRVAVDDVSFAVEEGEIFGVLGHNGAGKTTTVECISGVRVPDGGSVSVMGGRPHRDTWLREEVGVQLQESGLPDRLRVGEALELFASFYAAPRDRGELLEVVELAEHRDQPFKALSGGLKQRLSLALALVGNPRIAVLDELTTGLDPHARRLVWQLVEDVRAAGVTVVLVTHFMEEVERLCDRAAVLDGGGLLALDTPSGLVGRVRAQQRLRFRPSAPLDDALLTGLPEVEEVTRAGGVVAVAGTGELVHAVTALLAREGVIAEGLRIDQVTLDDAFVTLTGHSRTGEE